MTIEIAIGVLVLGSLVTGIWIGWRVHHLLVVEEVKRELVVFNQDIALSFKTVHSRIDEILAIPKTVEKDITKDFNVFTAERLTQSTSVPTNN